MGEHVRTLFESEIADLLRQRWPMGKIAEKLGISSRTVHKAAQRIAARSLEKLKTGAGQELAEQMNTLHWVVEQAAAAFAKSMADSETLRIIEIEDPPGDPPARLNPNVKKLKAIAKKTRTQTEVRGQSGNPQYLQVIQSALREIREIYGFKDSIGLGGTPIGPTIATVPPAPPPALDAPEPTWTPDDADPDPDVDADEVADGHDADDTRTDQPTHDHAPDAT